MTETMTKFLSQDRFPKDVQQMIWDFCLGSIRAHAKAGAHGHLASWYDYERVRSVVHAAVQEDGTYTVFKAEQMDWPEWAETAADLDKW